MSKVIEPDIVIIDAGPVILGVPECPSGARVTHVWTKREVYVATFGIAKHAVTPVCPFKRHSRVDLAIDLASAAEIG